MSEEMPVFCKQVKEQIVDERHAAGLYDKLQGDILEDFVTSPHVWPGGAKTASSITGEEHQLMKALLNKIGMDENSHLRILEVIDNLFCSSGARR